MHPVYKDMMRLSQWSEDHSEKKRRKKESFLFLYLCICDKALEKLIGWI